MLYLWHYIYIGGIPLNRIELVHKLMEAKRFSSQEHNTYLSTPREYYPGELLYLREAHFVLAITVDNPPTMSELAGRLDVTIGAASQLTLQMETKGFVFREKSLEDRRKILVKLTPKGENLFKRHREYDYAQYMQISEMFSKFSNEDLEKFVEYEIEMGKVFRIL